MAVATFNYFHCVSVVHDGASVALVFAHPAVRCDGAAYRSWLWLPIVVLIELAALSALLARKLHRWHKKPDEVDSAFKYLREPYQRRFYWWELVVLARRTVLVALIVFLATSRRVQLLAVIFATMVALLVHHELNPYRAASDSGQRLSANYLELSVLSFHVCLAAVLMVLEQPYSKGTAAALATFVLVPTDLLIGVALWRVWTRKRGSHLMRRPAALSASSANSVFSSAKTPLLSPPASARGSCASDSETEEAPQKLQLDSLQRSSSASS
jgi:hypothetical protein